MKTFFQTLIAAAAFCLPAAIFAQGDAFIQIQGAGGTQTGRLDGGGNAMFDNVKPGPYTVALLVPAIQKVREAAASPTASQDDKHKNQIEILSWSWGASNPSSIGSATGGAGAGKVKFNEFTVKKTTDKASPALMKTVGATKSTLDRKTNHNGQDYYIVKMSDILVSSIQGSGGGGGGTSGEAPSESLSLNFTKIEFKY